MTNATHEPREPHELHEPRESHAPCIDLQDVSLQRGGRAILQRVRVTIGYGELVAMVGLNGAGKTSLLSLVAPLILRMASRLSAERLLLAADAIGLGIFSISGTSIALDAQMPRFVAAMMGVTTGVFGGVIRDVLCNDIPLILRDSRPYATCAFAGCWVYLLLVWLQFDSVYSVLAATAFILVARLVTYQLDIRLPH